MSRSFPALGVAPWADVPDAEPLLGAVLSGHCSLAIGRRKQGDLGLQGVIVFYHRASQPSMRLYGRTHKIQRPEKNIRSLTELAELLDLLPQVKKTPRI